MKGWVFDSFTGAFLSADPFIQAPGNLQSFNRYAYVWNNPMTLTDPSGFVGAAGAQDSACNVAKGLAVVTLGLSWIAGYTCSSDGGGDNGDDGIGGYSTGGVAGFDGGTGGGHDAGGSWGKGDKPSGSPPAAYITGVATTSEIAAVLASFAPGSSASASDGTAPSALQETGKFTSGVASPYVTSLYSPHRAPSKAWSGWPDFVQHYFNFGPEALLAGQNTPIDLGEVGLGNTFRFSGPTQNSVNVFKNALSINPSPFFRTYQRTIVNNTWTPGLFSVGHSTFFMSASCAGSSCALNFSIRDWFQDPLDIGIELAPPYQINYSWDEYVTRKWP